MRTSRRLVQGALLILAALAGSTTTPATAAPGQEAESNNVIPLIVIENVPLADAIRNLARQMDLNYILDPRVPGAEFGPGQSAPQPHVSVRWTNISAAAGVGLLLKDHKLSLVPNPATKVARIAPADQGVKPVPASEVGADTNAVIPLIVMDSMPVLDAIGRLATQAGLKLSIDPQVATGALRRGTVSVRWGGITARQALAAVLDNFDLVLTEDPATASARVTSRPSKPPTAPGAGGQ